MTMQQHANQTFAFAAFAAMAMLPMQDALDLAADDTMTELQRARIPMMAIPGMVNTAKTTVLNNIQAWGRA